MSLKTALLYSPKYTEHRTGEGHPECPSRVSHVYDFLKKSGILNQLLFLEPRSALPKELELIHPPEYIRRVKETCEHGFPYLDSVDTAISNSSFEIAVLAAGGVLTLIDAVMMQQAKNGFALIRPPGHHAERERALGFCLFNNVAIGTRYIQEKHRLKRILIIDWDVHHGNGTQHLFEEDPSVFYFSVHQYPYYPGTGSEHEIGKKNGEGATLNVPLPAGAGDTEYRYVLEHIFYPKAVQFKPEFILISAGFDAHRDDPLAHMNLSDESYGFFTDVAMKLARASGHERIVSVLEGGYNLDALSRSIYVHVKHLMNHN